MLAPNEEVDLDSINYPVLASYKLDGVRCIFKNGEILSRSLKPIVNKQLREKFEPIRAWCEKTGNILDGEIYSPELTFQEIMRYVMTQDFEDKKSIKKFGEVLTIPDHLRFYCFDALYGGNINNPFQDRYKMVNEISGLIDIMPVIHQFLYCKDDVENYFKRALKDDCEGLILRSPTGHYKCGRGTLKEGLIYKVKPFQTFDSKIIGVIQATKVDPNAEKKTNELGRSVTSKKKDDRILIEKASAFLVEYEGKEVKPVLAMTDEEKVAIWANREQYIGKYIEYKGMLIGSKDVPRHPVMVRFREDKDNA